MPVLIVNGYMSDNSYSYSTPNHMHRHRWESADAETLLKKMVRDYDLLIKKGSISYYYITVVRLDVESEDLCSFEVIKKRVPLKEKVQLNAKAKGKTPPRTLRFTVGNGEAPPEMPSPVPMSFFYSDTIPVTATNS